MKKFWLFFKISISLYALAFFIGACQPKGEKQNKNQQGNYPEIKLLGKLKNVSSKQIQSSHLGLQFNPIAPHHDIPASQIDIGSIDSLLERSDALGVKWARFSVNWISVQDSSGQFHWEYPDRSIFGLLERGIEPYVCLHNGHPAYTQGLPPVSPQGKKAWLNFVDSMVSRYGEKVTYWEIWNEPNYISFWQPKPNPADYVELVRITTEKIKALDSNAIILGASLARMDLPYAKEIFDKGIAPYLDVVTIHPYNAIPEGIVRKIAYPVKTPDYYMPSSNSIDSLKALIAKHKPEIEIWQAENGYPSGFNSHGWQGTGPYGNIVQAKWLLRRAMTDLSYGAKVSAYFALCEYKLSPGDWKKNRKGLLKLHTHKPKPAYFVLQHLTSALQGKLKTDSLAKMQFEITDYGSFAGIRTQDIYQATFTRAKGGNIAAYWLPVRMQEKTLPAQIQLTLKNIEFQEPLFLDLLDGKVYEPQLEKQENTLIFKNLPLQDYPFLIVEKQSIELQ